jgi:hypothetical protein
MVSAFRNAGVKRILLHRLKLKMGLKSVHPFQSREVIEKIVQYACADSLAEIMGTLAVFGELDKDDVCCLLPAVCCLLPAVCCLLSTVCCLLPRSWALWPCLVR